MTDIVTATMRHGLGDQGASLRFGTRRCGRLAATLALAACLAGCALATGDAWAGWSKTVAVEKSKTCGVPEREDAPAGAAFDVHGAVWIACEPHGASGGLEIGRLTSRYRLTDTHVVPDTEGLVIQNESMSINRSGVAVLAWSYYPAADEGAQGPPAEGVAGITWHVGHPPGHPIELLSEHVGLWRTPSVAISPNGQAVVLFASNRWATPGREELPGEDVQAALIQHDHLEGIEPLLTPTTTYTQVAESGHGTILEHPEASVTPAGAFRASWQLVDEPFGSRAIYPPPEQVETARGNSSGVFSRPEVTEVIPISPVANPPLGSFSYAGTASNARGDQAVTWVSGPVSGIGDPNDPNVANVYVASRRAGQPFAAPQLIGEGPYGGPYGGEMPRTAIGPTGRITILWQGASHQLLAATGSAGGTFGAPRPIAPDTGLGSITVAVTPREQVIAIWERKAPEGVEGTIESATSNNGAHFTRVRVISKRNAHIVDCSSPSLTVARTGAALAEWQCLTATPEQSVDEFARYEP